MKVGEKTTRKGYTLWGNVSYLIGNMWSWDKRLFSFYIIQIPLIVLGPLISIYVPKVLIDSVAKNVSVKELLINLSIPIMGIVLTETILKGSKLKTELGGVKYRFNYVKLQVNKAVDTDFENIDGSEGQDKFTKATMATGQNNAGTEAIARTSLELASNILGILIYGGIIFTIHPLVVLFILVSSFINYIAGDYANKFEFKNKDNLSPINKKLTYIQTKSGDFKAAKDLRLYNMSYWFRDMYNIFLEKRINIQKQNLYRKYFANVVDGLLVFFRDGIVYGFLIYSVLYKDMAIGNFVLYFAAVAGLSNWLSGIVKNLNSLNTIHLETSDLRSYLDMEDRMNRGEGIELPKDFELPCDIELKNLYFKYPNAEDYTIKNMNLKINKGEKLALVGINGAGKTTLVKLICGLYTPTKGEILINGKNIELYNRDEYYTLFSVVFQDTYLLPLSIEKNITLQEDNIDSERLEKILKISGLDEKINSLPKGKDTLMMKSIYDEAIDLSGGEMQKLMLARALYKGSPIMVLDEPTAALDPIAENEIYQKYNDMTKDNTSIFISHRLSSTRFCDRIIFMEDGEIIEDGNHYTLIDEGGKYKEMFDMQSHYYKEHLA